MNTRIFTKLLQKAGIEVIEAFRDYMKSPKALNEVEPTINKKEFGKFSIKFSFAILTVMHQFVCQGT